MGIDILDKKIIDMTFEEIKFLEEKRQQIIDLRNYFLNKHETEECTTSDGLRYKYEAIKCDSHQMNILWEIQRIRQDKKVK